MMCHDVSENVFYIVRKNPYLNSIQIIKSFLIRQESNEFYIFEHAETGKIERIEKSSNYVFYSAETARKFAISLSRVYQHMDYEITNSVWPLEAQNIYKHLKGKDKLSPKLKQKVMFHINLLLLDKQPINDIINNVNNIIQLKGENSV